MVSIGQKLVLKLSEDTTLTVVLDDDKDRVKFSFQRHISRAHALRSEWKVPKDEAIRLALFLAGIHSA